MKGKYRVVVETNRVRYEFEIQRNITVIQGDSATGKTTIVDLLRLYALRGEASGVRVEAEVACRVYSGSESGDEWKLIIGNSSQEIVFIDEDYGFVFTKDFAEAIQHSDSYFVVITRRPLYYLPVSVNEIYGIRTSGRYHFPQKIYQEFYRLYPAETPKPDTVKKILVEDSGAGYQFFASLGNDVECISANGNSNIYRRLLEIGGDGEVLVIADGAAFGAYIEKILSLLRINRKAALYLPESFEWMILKSGIFEDVHVRDILENPCAYADSKIYFSWEQFFEKELLDVSAKFEYARYDKSALRDYYLTERSRKKIIDVMPKELKIDIMRKKE